MREPNFSTLALTGKVAYDPPRFMSVNEAIAQLLETEARRGEGGEWARVCMHVC